VRTQRAREGAGGLPAIYHICRVSRTEEEGAVAIWSLTIVPVARDINSWESILCCCELGQPSFRSSRGWNALYPSPRLPKVSSN
jgi:hypothetical protein